MTTDEHPKIVRRDSLPEHARYQDTGCELSPSCLRCPPARCQFDTRPSDYALTRREIGVLTLIVEGKADKGIAADLRISIFTVHRHVSHILTKMNAESRTGRKRRYEPSERACWPDFRARAALVDGGALNRPSRPVPRLAAA